MAAEIPRAVPQPRPLPLSPSFRIWKEHAGEHYLVFVDESFDGLFELRQNGYFVHGAVGIPEREYAAFSAEFAPVLTDYRTLTQTNVTELKHRDFRQIEYAGRSEIARRLAELVRVHGGFVAGFYTPVRSFVLERVRTNCMDTHVEMPDPIDAAYGEAEAELRTACHGPGQAGAIARLLELAVGGVANMLTSFGCDFTVIYDPRHPREDRQVSADVEAYLKLHEAFKTLDADIPADLGDRFRAFVHDRRSEQETGLQLADVVAGEVRRFFVAYPDLLTHGASRRLVTPESVEPVMTVMRIGRRFFKTGVLHRMPAALQAWFAEADCSGATVFHHFVPVLAAGILTGYSSEGQPRDLMPFAEVIWDQCE